MIGFIRFVDPDGDRLLKATLEDDGMWICPESPWVTDWLNSDFSPIGVLQGAPCWGQRVVIAAARRLKGQAAIPAANRNGSALPAWRRGAKSHEAKLPCRDHGNSDDHTSFISHIDTA